MYQFVAILQPPHFTGRAAGGGRVSRDAVCCVWEIPQFFGMTRRGRFWKEKAECSGASIFPHACSKILSFNA